MLTLTPAAAEAVRGLVASAPIDDEGGIRIAVGEPTPAGTPLQIELVDAPETTDASIEEHGVHVFLEPAVAEFLDDKVLDARIESGRASFEVRDERPFDPGADAGGPPA